MTTYNYNSELIKAMNEKLPNGTNLANTLIDMLYLGKEAVYRRLRGEVPFTLEAKVTTADAETQRVEIEIHHCADELHHSVRDALDVDEVEVGHVVPML